MCQGDEGGKGGKQDTIRPRVLNFGYNQNLSTAKKNPPKSNKTELKHTEMQDKAFASLDT